MKKSRASSFSVKPWAVAVWLVVWQAAAMLVGKELLLVSPWRTVTRLWELGGDPVFWGAVGYTLLRIAGGFLAATALAVVLAALAGRFRRVRELLSPLMITVKTVPVASVIVVILIWFTSKKLSVIISGLMVLPIIYTNTLEGLLSRDPLMAETARVFGMKPLRRAAYIDLPQVLPFFRSGCRVALGLCWKAGVAAELIGQPSGSIGWALNQSRLYLETRDVFAWTLAIILLSVLCEKLALLGLSALAERLRRV